MLWVSTTTGDSSIYEPWSVWLNGGVILYMLVDGHGNFGSMDGDGAAAQRLYRAHV